MPTNLVGRTIRAIRDAPSSHAVYTELLADDVLAFQLCGACDAAVFPPRQRCHQCGADSLSWRGSSGGGTIYSTTVIRPRAAEPYCVVLVDLDEGYRMMSRITDADADAVAIDDRVEVRFQHSDGDTQPHFVPVGGGVQ